MKDRNIGLHCIPILLSVALEGIEHPSDEYAVVNKTPIDFQKFENDATIQGMEIGFLSLSSLSPPLSQLIYPAQKILHKFYFISSFLCTLKVFSKDFKP